MAYFKTMQGGRPLYHVRWNYRLNADGKQVYDQKRFRNEKEAERLNKEKTAGHTLQTETISVRQLDSLWLVEHVDVNLSQRTRKDYRCQLDKRIRPLLGHKQVSKLTPRVVGQWRDRLVADGVGPRTVNKSLDTLKSMIRWGRSEGLCTNSMIDDVRRVRAPRPKPANPYPPDVIQSIVEATPWLREATLILVAAYSGLRWSELRALRWKEVDLDAGTILVVHALDLDKSDKDPKGRRSRIVPLLAPGFEALKQWRKQVPEATYVFPTSNDRPLGEFNWYGQRLPKIRKASGVHFDLHEMRDTYASILIQSGVGQAELTLWLGHRRIQTTIDRYGQLFERCQARHVATANAALLTMSAVQSVPLLGEDLAP